MKTEIIDIWNYLSDSKKLIGKSNAVKNQLPKYCTTVAPPDIPEGKVTVFDETNQVWLMQDDAPATVTIVRVYGYAPDTMIYIGAADAMVDDIPANCTPIAPDAAPPAGYVLTFDTDSGTWCSTEDHRGEIVWDTADATEIYINFPGPYPACSTTKSPANVPYPVWSGSQWVTDADQQQQANIRDNVAIYNDLMLRVVSAQCPLQSAVAQGIALTQSQQEVLTELQQYAVTLAQFIQSADLTQSPLVFPESQPGVLEYPVSLNSTFGA
ncbi:tail fiber assembly protein [Citrobacter sp. S2-9]|uniref:Tail fiber assembly protein n=1 Tax=Citrobacter enshiensis TaxID=2971264 RepID=A0ABT8PTP4_9ENTR|nr:tail fiber assembly protein [Citrobacter enshiensis]MDN8598879.1 tail fiber assembly protein [Citrobacter enshiensis]